MAGAMRKEEFLADLKQRHADNRQTVETVFLALDQEARSWQPAPGEWSVDQCFQHLILSFEMLSPNTTDALNKPERSRADGTFKSTWLARWAFPRVFNPDNKTKTKDEVNPQSPYSAEVLHQYLAQHDRLGAMIDQGAQADLQAMCWFSKFPPVRFNLGDMLNNFVLHDALHINQAERSLQGYGEHQSMSAD